jgi:rhodanese-related sulfurtransferase
MSFLSFLFKKPDYILDGTAFKQKALALGKKATLIDVRTPGECSGGILPKAKNINFMAPDFLTKVKHLTKDNTYFVYCRSGHRSKSAVKQMKAAGYEAYSLSGGMGSWRS